MPWQGLPMHAHQPPTGPHLFLYPNNDSFIPKMISLSPSGNRVKIGRQTNAKTIPGERNGYFDSKVLSRQHAEVWEEGGKIYIKDVKSSNGTFVNGERLSVEGVESEPWELKSEDRVEFGIDIVGEDNKTIIHHKVAATVFCVITPDDYAQLPAHHPLHHGQHPNGNFHLQGQQQRRPSIQQVPSPGGLGGMGGGTGLGFSGRAGKSGLTFDHILNRLQTELQKSRETGSDLNSLASVMTDINDTLAGGAGPPSHPPNHGLPPVRPPQAQSQPQPQPTANQPPASEPDVSLTSIQSQLIQTQSSLASHADKVKSLENVIAEHEQVKREVQHMRDLMEQRKREMETLISANTLRANGENGHSRSRNSKGRTHEAIDDDDDDAQSVITVVPEGGETHEPSEHDAYSQEERDRDEEEDRRARTEAMGRPRTPEPHGLDEDDEEGSERHSHPRQQYDSGSLMPPTSNFSQHSFSLSQSSPNHPLLNGNSRTTDDLHSQNALLSTRLEALTNQLDTALSLSRALQSQTEAAQINIERLEAKVESLEAFVEKTKMQQQENAEEREELARSQATRTVTSEAWDAWRQRVEGEWKIEREGWEGERIRLKDAVREWEARMVELEVRDRDRAAEERELLDSIKRKRDADDEWVHEGDQDDDGDLSQDEDDAETKHPVNGILHRTKGIKRRSMPTTKPSKLRKRKSSHAAIVATPPHSPILNGDSSYIEHSSEGSGSRPTSPALHSQVKGLTSEIFGNGHSKLGALPLSPAPSVRHGENRSASVDSEIEVVEDENSGASDQQAAAFSTEKQDATRPPRFGESPLPYISAAGVVFIGLAAWVVTTRVKD